MSVFQLPAGTATASNPIARSSGSQLVLPNSFIPYAEKSAAKLVVHLLKCRPGGADAVRAISPVAHSLHLAAFAAFAFLRSGLFCSHSHTFLRRPLQPCS